MARQAAKRSEAAKNEQHVKQQAKAGGNVTPIKPAKQRRKIERKPRRYWRPEPDGAQLVARLGSRHTNHTRYGERAAYMAVVLEDTDDSQGALVAGTPIMIGESADLKRLQDVPEGDIVYITPAGVDDTGKGNPCKMYDLESEEDGA